MSEILRSDIVLSVTRALLGEVFRELVAVSCELVNEEHFELIFFVDSVLSPSVIEDVSCIEAEVMADFPDDVEISHRIVVSDHPLLSPSGFLIFLRKSS